MNDQSKNFSTREDAVAVALAPFVAPGMGHAAAKAALEAEDKFENEADQVSDGELSYEERLKKALAVKIDKGGKGGVRTGTIREKLFQLFDDIYATGVEPENAHVYAAYPDIKKGTVNGHIADWRKDHGLSRV